jgi:hypothetical protein
LQINRCKEHEILVDTCEVFNSGFNIVEFKEDFGDKVVRIPYIFRSLELLSLFPCSLALKKYRIVPKTSDTYMPH